MERAICDVDQSNLMTIELKDGDDLTVKTSGSSCWDPTGKYSAVRTFRVVAVKGPYPHLELVPLGSAKICGLK